MLRCVGFCGVDHSVSPDELRALSHQHPWIEWGVLFRPDAQGIPRYPSWPWVQSLASSHPPIRLAAHLCGAACEGVLEGDTRLVEQLLELGFCRVQINATAINGVALLKEHAQGICRAISSMEGMEWILQYNSDTEEFCAEVLLQCPGKVSVLFDGSMGRGMEITEFKPPLPGVRCGYAGGICPDNMSKVLAEVRRVAASGSTWVDMESGVRSDRDGVDVFDLNKVTACVSQVKQDWVTQAY